VDHTFYRSLINKATWTSTLTMSTVAPIDPSPVQTAPPISQLLPLLSNAIKFTHSAALFFLDAVTQLTYPVRIIAVSPLPLLLNILSPVIIFGNILLDTLFLTPLYILSSILGALYPVYVFLGVACISALLLAVIGRVLSQALVAAVLDPHSYRPPHLLTTQLEQWRRSPESKPSGGKRRVSEGLR
jgi:hypothetical protein